VSDDPHSPFISRAEQGVLTARFAVLVDADGRVLDAHVTIPSGREPEHLILDGALVEALRRFHFLPARKAGFTRRGWSTVECTLRLGPN
jgi:TonB family protein